MHGNTKTKRDVKSHASDSAQGAVKKDIATQLTAGDDPADLGAGNLEEDTKGCDPGIGVQHCV